MWILLEGVGLPKNKKKKGLEISFYFILFSCLEPRNNVSEWNFVCPACCCALTGKKKKKKKKSWRWKKTSVLVEIGNNPQASLSAVFIWKQPCFEDEEIVPMKPLTASLWIIKSILRPFFFFFNLLEFLNLICVSDRKKKLSQSLTSRKPRSVLKPRGFLV